MAGQSNQAQHLYGESLKPETVVRVRRHERDYLQVSNSTVQDARLSWEARGLLVYLLSLPRDWEIRVSHLQKQGNAGRDALRRMLRELQEFGYASGVGRESQERGERGRFGQTEIAVYETPALNPFFSADASPSPENPSTVAAPSAVRPSPGSPSPENPPTYKEQNPQRTNKTNPHTTQTGLRAADAGAPAEVVAGVNSKFSLKDCRRYADYLHASGQGVKNPGGFARTIHTTGSEDGMIALWLAEVDPERVRSGELAPPPPPRKCPPECPLCFGGGMQIMEGKGARRCPNLTAQAQPAAQPAAQAVA